MSIKSVTLITCIHALLNEVLNHSADLKIGLTGLDLDGFSDFAGNQIKVVVDGDNQNLKFIASKNGPEGFDNSNHVVAISGTMYCPIMITLLLFSDFCVVEGDQYTVYDSVLQALDGHEPLRDDHQEMDIPIQSITFSADTMSCVFPDVKLKNPILLKVIDIGPEDVEFVINTFHEYKNAGLN